MKITTKTSLMGFLIALSAISTVAATEATAATQATNNATPPIPQTIEGRLSRLSAAIQARAEGLAADQLTPEQLIARGWADGHGRDWVNGRGGRGWADGNGRSWVNGNSWRNGWADGGGFANWRNY